MKRLWVLLDRMFLLSCLTALFLALSAGQAHAQQATAQITGTVKDPSGAVIAGALVTLRNVGTNMARSTKTGKEGDYLFTLLPIGTYDLTVSQQGFGKYLQTGITLQINQYARQDVTLQVGASAQVVEVQGDVTQIDTVSASLGKVETTTRIENLPLAARDTMQLGLLQAGTFAPDQDDGSNNPFSVSGRAPNR